MANHSAPPPEWLDAKFLESSLRKSLSKPDLTVTKVDIGPGSAVGENYGGQIFRIIVHFNNNEKMSIIGKVQPFTKLIEQLDNFLDVFETEGTFFARIVPQLKNFTDIGKVIPTAYSVDFEKKIIFMEDLKESGYFLQKRNVFLNREQVRLTVEALAALHGSSYQLLQADPSVKEKYARSQWTEPPNPVIAKLVENASRALDKWVDTFNLRKDLTEKIPNIKRKLDKNWFKVLQLREENLNVLIHGDCWTNNMMYHESSGCVDGVKLFDFQVVNYNCFANDLQNFIFGSAHRDVIISDLDWLLERYYHKLLEIAPEIPNLTLARIKSEFESRYFFGLVMATTIRPLSYFKDAIDFDNLLGGGLEDSGFKAEQCALDLAELLPFFDKVGEL